MTYGYYPGMGQPSQYPLDEYVVAIASGLTPQADTPRRGRLSSDRAAELDEQLRQLHSARQVAESESRQYPVS
jgi:hypothetical protein